MALDVAKPQQIVLVTTQGKAEVMGRETVKDNIITIAWHMPMSFDPPLYGISVGKNRFSYKLLKDSKAFCVNFIPHSMKDAALGCGTTSGMDTDKFTEFGLTPEECEHIDCKKIAEADGWLECEIIDSIETGDHVVFIGKVHKEQTKQDRKRLLYSGMKSFTTTL